MVQAIRRCSHTLAGVVFAAVGLVGSASAATGEPWIDQPFGAGARAMLEAVRQLEAPPDATVHVVFRDASYSFDAAGRITYQQRLIYHLLAPQAVEGWSRVQVDYAPWHQEPPQIRARVITADGSEHWLAAADVREGPAASDDPDVVADRRIVEAALPSVRVGAVIEEEVVVRDVEPFFEAGTAGTYPLKMFAPIHRGRFRLSAPTSVPLRYGVRLMDLKPRQRLTDDAVELVFEYQDIPAAGPIDAGLRSQTPRLPQVAFSTGESWQAVAQAYARHVDEKIMSSDLSEWMGRLPALEESAAPAERIAAILDELHSEVRYSGLELGASSLVPAAPELTLERGFGDCKDQATLLAALLRAEGIPASVALLNAGFGHDVETRLPGIGRFNHAVVYVSVSPPTWIDPTDPAARAGELPAADQNRWALVADASTTKLLRTPSANSVDNLTVEHREVYLADHGPGRVVERSIYHGEPERQQRRIAQGGTEESRRQGYWEYVESTYLAEELGEVEEGDPDDLSEPFFLKLEALDSSRAVTDLSEAVVAIRQEDLTASLPRILQRPGEPRQIPFVVEQPYVTRWHYRIVPPPGFAARPLPAGEEHRFGPARYERTLRLRDDGSVSVDLLFDSGPRFLSAEAFEQMRSGLLDFLAAEPLLVWFDHVGAAAMGEGRGRDAIDQFRRFAELEPEKAIHRIRLAQALLRLGIAREAWNQARIAVELEPVSALAHWSLGFALEHDEIGRRFTPPFDRPAALEALERAVELDPDDTLARTELAILLEYDDEGRRYTPQADLDRAVAQYRILNDELGAQNLDVNLISALYWARRWQELYAATLRYGQSPVSRYLHLVALAVLQGPEAAVRESGNLASGPEERSSLLNSAAQHLVIARLYGAAAALLEKVAGDAPEASSLRRRAEVLAAAVPHEELEIQTATPAEIAKSLLLVLGKRDVDEAELARLFHPGYLADRGDEESALGATFAKMRQEQLQSVGDLPVEAVLDLALSILETAVDGDSRVGYRVRLLNQMNRSKVAFRIYVTPFEDRLTIAAVEDEYGQIGKEVWRRLEAGDLRGAHQWLDWARDVIDDTDSDDPFGFKPFARYWTRGTGAFRDRMRLGAALLMANQPEAAEAVPVLEAALATAEGATAEGATVDGDGDLRSILEVALLLAYSRLEDNAKLGAVSARLLEREPSSTLAFLGRCQQLFSEKRYEDLDRVAEKRLSLEPQDAHALRYLVRSALRQSDVERAIEGFETLQEAGRIDVSDDNLWSWVLLFRDPVPEKALELAERGAASSRFRDRPMLNTLAAVYAETGRPAEARQALVQSLELKENRLPESDDWYVLGRIVDEYGFIDLAREYYGRVDAAKPGATFTTAELVERRLRVLSGGGKKRRGAP